MKRRSIKITSVHLWILIAFSIAVIVGTVLLSIYVLDREDINELVLDLLKALVSAVTVGVIVTTTTGIITDNFIKVQKNNQKLREFGVRKIGSGMSDTEDTRLLFGRKNIKKYPDEIKIMFISGNGFFARYQNELYTCLKNSNCSVKILLLSTDVANQSYIQRMEEMCPQKPSYYDQVNKEALPILQSVIDRLEDDKKHRIQVRFYTDEYRYNFRIAIYNRKEESQGFCWLNVQPFNKDAAELSVGLDGAWSSTDSSPNNIYELLDIGFDQIWDKYAKTEYKFNK